MLIIASSALSFDASFAADAKAQTIEEARELRQARRRFKSRQRRLCVRRRPNRVGPPLRECIRRRVQRRDSDRDGVSIRRDNCPNTINIDQLDSNNDGIGDACSIGFNRVILQEVSPDSRRVTLLNESSGTVDLSNYWFCVNNGGGYVNLANSAIEILDGSLSLATGETISFDLSQTAVADRFSLATGTDIGLYSSNEFTNPEAIVDYVRFRETAFSGRIDIAVQANIWDESTFVDLSSISGAAVLNRTGTAEGVQGWTVTNVSAPTPTFDLDRAIISEVDPTAEKIELINQSESVIDLSSYWLCVNNGGGYINMASPTLALQGDGDLLLSPNEVIVIDLSNSTIAGRLANSGGTDVGLYNSSSFANPNALVDYVKIGANAPVGREAVGVQAGLWTADTYVTGNIPSNSTAQRVNGDIGTGAWSISTSTLGNS